MSSFSTKERFIASLLSSAPGIKRWLKRVYVTLNALLYRKGYTHRILQESIGEIYFPFTQKQEESFFGYYDKCPDNGQGIILAHLAKHQTAKKPSATSPISIAVCNTHTGSVHEVAKSDCYNWQQGSRSQWLDNDSFIYNGFDEGCYKSFVYSIGQNKIIKVFDFPVQDSFGKEFFLSLDYRRIMSLRPDYGYRNLPSMNNEEMDRLAEDGIWYVDYKSGKAFLLHSLRDIAACNPKEFFSVCKHKVNHVMLSPDGNRFIFIHRFYKNGRRFDRLMLSDFHQLKVLADEEMVSHCCWVDNVTILGYLRYGGTNGFYYIDTCSGQVRPCVAMNAVSKEDGHPCCYGDWTVFDTYPDRSRLQHLYLYNRKTDKVVPLLELYHGIKYMGESRCDLHPRFSADGQKVFFDTVCSGKRALAYIDISHIIQS